MSYENPTLQVGHLALKSAHSLYVVCSQDCATGLKCFQRNTFQPVPGCLGQGIQGHDYCHRPRTLGGNSTVVGNPVMASSVTYKPGEATVLQEGLMLSTGLQARKIATRNQRVQYFDGSQSTELFHTAPDGAAVFEDTATGDYVYVSNSESATDGGVGAIRFNAQGQIIGYQRLLFKDPISGVTSKNITSRNCGGGKTYWGTWMTCEERRGGQVWEVDPWGRVPGRQTKLGGKGRAYESAAYDNRDPVKPTFYVTTDEINGPLVKYTPAQSVSKAAAKSGDYSRILHSGGGLIQYFKINTIKTNADGTASGTYVWSTSEAQGNTSAATYHVQGEGIDIRQGKLYYTTKTAKYLFIIDLDKGTFSRSSTVSGAFDAQPDQVARVLDLKSGATDGILYFCEDGGAQCGVHGRDAQGRFFTILQSASAALSGETTGLAFSPRGMYMYVSFQGPGIIFEISRTDGLPFQGGSLDIKYHGAGGDSGNFVRNLYEDNVKTCEYDAEMCGLE